ncbi:MAG: DUF1361 domain-containing protein [Candidatus Promineifilaceae bacterium]|nr:DUF1361 domain-containing protein [Candidatus Promineifilaceae bacterium]
MRKWTLLTLLICISLFSVAMVVARILYSGRYTFINLNWNLFLAWLPILFAALAVRWRKRPFLALTLAFLWLLFLPNAPYLVTDLIYLRTRAPVPFLYDMIMLLSFAALGLFLGLVSLRMMQGLVCSRFGAAAGWIFVMSVLAVSGLGVYIGRVLRWNSWDLFVRPLPLLNDVRNELSEPQTIVISGIMAVMMIGAYVLLTTALDLSGGLKQQTY